ncbi:MAG: hypothetical protein VR74_06215 [Hyphomonas sp. BRH_c22]|uniref:hypothetical protein n=1 Tax=Hyphomonas sp. BRH_c22 TaxID=1629710 RepID=UPI0005F2042F|nr:hypothetical protein [Hyphomonas sp. BRH_c22]KJS38208.1 MAG: hypothetical protein VR74_06215 [Hyphomonas sp. BRH_c22]
MLGLLFALAMPAYAAPSTAGCLEISAPESKISQQCESIAASPSLKGYEAGIASFNAARAYLGQASGAANSTGHFVKAAELLSTSFNRLTDTDLLSPDRGTLGFSKKEWKKWQKAPLAGFRFDRSLAYASALEGLANAAPFVATSVCSSQQDCRSKALTRLASEEIAAPFAPRGSAQGDWRYNEFYFRRGALYQARGQLADTDMAIDNFKTVLSSRRPERKSDAAIAMEAMALRVADENRARGGMSLGQAIKYYSVALVAKPDSGRAQEGLGQSYLQLCRETSTTPAQRVTDCLSARNAFDAAKGLAGADQTLVFLGLGESLSVAAAELAKVSPGDGNILLYKQASVDAYAQAASGSGGNAKAQLMLANALKATQPDRASEAYRQYVAMELAYPDWIAADWQSPVGPLFQQKVFALPSLEDRRSVAEAIMALYEARSVTNGLRKDVALSLLNAALAAQPSLIEASLKVGRLHLAPPANGAAANTAFLNVVNATGGPNGPPSVGREKERAEAFYELGRAEALKSSSATRAQTSAAGIKYARDAFSLDGAEVRYKKAACLSYIVTFTPTAADPGNASWCSGIGGADGQFLLGMYYLRIAQTAPTSRRNALRDEAQSAFIQGKGLIGQTAGGPVTVFESDWPKAPPAMSIATLLEFGRAKAIACNGASVNLALPPADVNAAASQFDFFQVGACTR